MIVTAFLYQIPSVTTQQANAIGIAALVDGDVNLGTSVQDGSQLNNCDTGAVNCDNVGVNQLLLTADGPDSEVNLDTNTQTDSQTNNCTINIAQTASTTCANTLVNDAEISALDNAVISISDNTQTGKQSNDCSSNAFATTCSNAKTNLFIAQATNSSTISGSNTQTAGQANTCANAAMS